VGNKSACARNGHRVEIESACAHDGGINVDDGDDGVRGIRAPALVTVIVWGSNAPALVMVVRWGS
jgi:hypothetical protein